MVSRDGGQLYTIEGVAAALIMLITAYMVINATSVYTAGDTHISDMQLETLGTDALIVMDSPINSTEYAIGNSTLGSLFEDDYTTAQRNDTFRKKFLELVGADGVNPGRDVQFTAIYTCRDPLSAPPLQVKSKSFSNSSRGLTGTEHPVRVTKWVTVNNSYPVTNPIKENCGGGSSHRAVLVEVLLWLD